MGVNSPHYVGVNWLSNRAVTIEMRHSRVLFYCWNAKLAGSRLSWDAGMTRIRAPCLWWDVGLAGICVWDETRVSLWFAFELSRGLAGIRVWDETRVWLWSAFELRYSLAEMRVYNWIRGPRLYWKRELHVKVRSVSEDLFLVIFKQSIGMSCWMRFRCWSLLSPS